MLVTPPLFLQLAFAEASSVAPSTSLAFAWYESALNPNAIHDNTTGLTHRPDTAPAAIALAASLLAKGHSLDLGIMQVNSTNLARTGLTVSTAFDPGQSIRAGAQILVAAYQRCRHGGQVAPQAALRCAASVYNTGSEQAGILNGYQARVWRVAAQIVPAIAIGGVETVPEAPAPPVTPPPPPQPRLLVDALHPTQAVPLEGGSLNAFPTLHKETSR